MKCGVWRAQCEVWGVKSAVWSVECEESNEKWEVWSVDCEVWSVKCEVWSVKCEVWIGKSAVWSVQCGVWRVQWEVWRAKWRFKCDMWNRTPLSQNARTHGLGWRTAHASSIDEKGLIYIFKATGIGLYHTIYYVIVIPIVIWQVFLIVLTIPALHIWAYLFPLSHLSPLSHITSYTLKILEVWMHMNAF